MDNEQIKKIFLIGGVLFLILGIILYAVNTVNFNFKGKRTRQAPKTGLGYLREGRSDFMAPNVFLLGDFTTNMSREGNAGKFLRTQIRVEMSDKDLVDEMKDKNILLRDAVISTMSDKRFTQISSKKGKIKLKEEIKNRLNSVLQEGEIEEVYFTIFIIQ